MSISNSNSVANNRLASLDFFRGFTMFILIGSVLYELMRESDNAFINKIGWQLEHQYWHGLSLWDFVEPFFMFIVGVAIPFSVMNRLEKGDSWNAIFKHVLKRSVILFFLGVFIYSVSAGKPAWKLWNVLTQLSLTSFVAFLLMRKPIPIQLSVSFLLLLISELLYRFWAVEGYHQPFTEAQNFGSWIDMKLMGQLEGDNWVAFNVVPTTAFTIWGVIAGLILRSKRTYQLKLKILICAGLVGVVAGFALDPITPMIKRIATSSIIIETGGWCLIMLAFCYWLVDIKKVTKIPNFFAIVGLNSLFIYLFEQLGGVSLLSRLAQPFSYALLFWSGSSGVAYGTAILSWFLMWYICYWLYKYKIFIKI